MGRKSLDQQMQANEGRRSSESEVVRYQQLYYNTQEKLKKKECELKSRNAVEMKLSQQIDSSKKKLRSEQEKMRKFSLEMLSRDTQYKHEKKKYKQETHRLLEKLNKLLQD